MEIRDLVALAAPRPVMVIVGTEDRIVPAEGVAEVNRQMQSAYEWAEWAGSTGNFGPSILRNFTATTSRFESRRSGGSTGT